MIIKNFAVSISDIDYTTLDPRFEKSEDPNLQQSIQDNGILNPVILTGLEAPYTVVDGHRRVRIASDLGLASVPAIIHPELSDLDALKLIYNSNSYGDLTKMERAFLVRKMLHEGASQEEIQTLLGIKKSTVENMVKLSRLHPLLDRALRDGAIKPCHALVLAKEPGETLPHWIERVEEEKLSVRALTDKLKKSKPAKMKPKALPASTVARAEQTITDNARTTATPTPAPVENFHDDGLEGTNSEDGPTAFEVEPVEIHEDGSVTLHEFHFEPSSADPEEVARIADLLIQAANRIKTQAERRAA